MLLTQQVQEFLQVRAIPGGGLIIRRSLFESSPPHV
jgi:hypothetical protein